jgi:hypothetical protein
MALIFLRSLGLAEYAGTTPLLTDYDEKSTWGAANLGEMLVYERKTAAPPSTPLYLVRLRDAVRDDLVVCDDYVAMMDARVYLSALVRAT